MRCVCVCGVCVHAHIHTYDTYILVSPHGGSRREGSALPASPTHFEKRPAALASSPLRPTPPGRLRLKPLLHRRARAQGLRGTRTALGPPSPAPRSFDKGSKPPDRTCTGPQTARARGPRPHVHGASSHGPGAPPFRGRRFARLGANANGPPGSRSPGGRSEAANDDAKRSEGARCRRRIEPPAAPRAVTPRAPRRSGDPAIR